MKKYFLLFLMAGVLSLSACSSDDDGETAPETDPIVGTWELVEVDISSVNVQGCEEETSFLTFNEGATNNSGTATGTFYLEQNGCEALSDTGDWENNGNSSYTITVPYLGSLDGTANFTSNGFTFSSSFGGVPLVLTFEEYED